jgi:ubiquinone/menaquinone biosynthesis C-methylase UbiE
VDPRTSKSVDAYDRVAAEYLERWRDARPRDAAKKFGAMAGRGATILDAACGPVLDVRVLRDAGVHVVAGDLSQECMRVGKTYFPKGSLARWDYRRLPFADDTFGGIWAAGALQHLPLAEVRPALAELRRVHGRGPIFLSFPEGHAELAPLEDPPAGTVYVTKISADELKALLVAAGYREVEVEQRPDLQERPGLSWLYGWGRLPAA